MSEAGWQFDNSYGRLKDIFYTRLSPISVCAPEMVIFNESLAHELGLNFSSYNDPELAQIFAGNVLPDGADPIAQAYAGHQFGHPNVLGDGRAILLGEQISTSGKRFDVQLKGSGQTPYSRNGDGRAALGPMLREFIISEAMAALGIKTTRSLAVVATGEPVFREGALTGAVLTRIADSHLRVGTFEYAAMRRDQEGLQQLLNYSIDRHYPEIKEAGNLALAFIEQVMNRQIDLICQWMRVGFIHGVMNTDNMTISGETIDYGPCAFMEAYDPATVFSSIDHRGRYAFGNQPPIAQWNLARLAETLLPLIDEDADTALEKAEEIVMGFMPKFEKVYLKMMGQKIGITAGQEGDVELIADLQNLLLKHKLDYTNAFRALSKSKPSEEAVFTGIRQEQEMQDWFARWQVRLDQDELETQESLTLRVSQNPAFIPRNQLVEEALEAAENNGQMTRFNKLLDVVTKPYKDNPQLQDFQAPMQSGHHFQTFCGT